VILDRAFWIAGLVDYSTREVYIVAHLFGSLYVLCRESADLNFVFDFRPGDDCHVIVSLKVRKVR
jgi:hypothetical protein